jgi:acetylornithine/LysW-gamma-L-lysine aminotransferase
MNADIYNMENKWEAPLYHKRGLAIVRGKGAVVWDADGKSYIDCIGGQGVALVGHANPDVAAAVHVQVDRLTVCPPFMGNDTRASLLGQLASVVPKELERFFLCNSGTEAVEAALKFARLSTGRQKVVAAKNGFHGRTMGALSATYRNQYRAPFEPLVPGFIHVPFNDIGAMKLAVDQDTAAVILEPVQGEGGVYPADFEYLPAVAALCKEKGALLIADEVQTGFGRTGKLFAIEHYGIVPDMMCLAKGIAGGLPMGAVAIGPRVVNLKPGCHGSTFGGNPLVCAAATAAIRYIVKNDLPARAAQLGANLRSQLQQAGLKSVREVRGLGLMAGIELRFRIGPYIAALQEAGVLAMGAGPQVIRLLPPLVIKEEELEKVAEALIDVLGK